jgi:membrane protein
MAGEATKQPDLRANRYKRTVVTSAEAGRHLRDGRHAVRSVVSKFLADRGTHLAAMIAYFALLSFVPLLFLALALVGLLGEQSESSFLVDELARYFPAISVDQIVRVVEGIREQATALSVLGVVGLAWGALGLFSVLESAFNIVYGLPNRPFFRGKALALVLVIAFVVVLFLGLVAGSFGVDLLRRSDVAGATLSYVYALLVSTLILLALVWAGYRLITNARPDLTWRETLPGAAFATAILQASFQVLPAFVRATGDLYALKAFGGLVLLLFWLYLMANVLVLGAEVNWWLARGRRRTT